MKLRLKRGGNVNRDSDSEKLRFLISLILN